jgi:two-component system, sensor histidine kinase and response regulator
MKGDRERCMAAGMDGYLSKPIRPQELDEMLDGYLARLHKVMPDAKAGTVPDVSVCKEELMERIDNDLTLLSEVLVLFRADYPLQIQNAREAVGKDDGAALQRVAHALQGALGNLAAPNASKLAGELLSMGKVGKAADAGPQVTMLEEELIRVIEALENLCLETVK